MNTTVPFNLMRRSKNCTLCRRACADTQTVLITIPVQYRRHAHLRSLRPGVLVCLPLVPSSKVNDVDKGQGSPERLLKRSSSPDGSGLSASAWAKPSAWTPVPLSKGRWSLPLRTPRCGLCLRYRFRRRPDHHGRSDGTPAPPGSPRNSYPAVHQLLPGLGRICRNPFYLLTCPASVVDQESYQHPQPGHQDLFRPAEEHRPKKIVNVCVIARQERKSAVLEPSAAGLLLG